VVIAAKAAANTVLTGSIRIPTPLKKINNFIKLCLI